MEEEAKPIPGGVRIRPTRALAETDPERFYSLLEELRGPVVLPLRKIAEVTGDTSLNPEPNLLRKIKSRTLSGEARRLLLRYMFDEEQLLSGRARRLLADVGDAFYFAFLEYFKIAEPVQDEARAMLTGTYKFWRHAADHAGEFLFGKLVCFEDPTSRALKVDIRMKKCSGGSSHRIDWGFSGYLFCVQHMYVIVARHTASEEVRVGFYPRCRTAIVGTDINPRSAFSGKQNHILHMDGMTFGIDRRSCFLSPIHLALVDDVEELAGLDDALDVIAEGDSRLPRRIAEKLKSQGPLTWL
jgi:hypothetical protein